MTLQGSALVAHCGAKMVTREDLKTIPVPEGTKIKNMRSTFTVKIYLPRRELFRKVQAFERRFLSKQQ